MNDKTVSKFWRALFEKSPETFDWAMDEFNDSQINFMLLSHGNDPEALAEDLIRANEHDDAVAFIQMLVRTANHLDEKGRIKAARAFDKKARKYAYLGDVPNSEDMKWYSRLTVPAPNAPDNPNHTNKRFQSLGGNGRPIGQDNGIEKLLHILVETQGKLDTMQWFYKQGNLNDDERKYFSYQASNIYKELNELRQIYTNIDYNFKREGIIDQYFIKDHISKAETLRDRSTEILQAINAASQKNVAQNNKQQSTDAQVSQTPQNSQPQASTYTVQKGDNLWNIAKKFYSLNDNASIQAKVNELVRVNQIQNPNLINIGQTLKLPKKNTAVV